MLMKKALAEVGVVVLLLGGAALGASRLSSPPKLLPPEPAVTPSQQSSMQKELMTVRESTVIVTGLDLGGGPTGSYTTESGNGFLVAPSYAIYDGLSPVGVDVSVSLANGKTVSGRVVKHSLANDISLIELNSPVLDVPYLRIAKTAPAPDSLVVGVGSPMNGQDATQALSAGMGNVDNFDHAWVGRVVGYTNGGGDTPSTTFGVMLATLRQTGAGWGQVVVNGEGQVVGVITEQEAPVSQWGKALLNPLPFKVTVAEVVRPAAPSVGGWEPLVESWTHAPKL